MPPLARLVTTDGPVMFQVAPVSNTRFDVLPALVSTAPVRVEESDAVRLAVLPAPLFVRRTPLPLIVEFTAVISSKPLETAMAGPCALVSVLFVRMAVLPGSA